MAWSVPRAFGGSVLGSRTSSTRFRRVCLSGGVDGAGPELRARRARSWAGRTGSSSAASSRARFVAPLACSRSPSGRSATSSSSTASPEEKVVVTPLGVDPAFTPGRDGRGTYLLFVGAIQERKDPLAAAAAASAVGLPLVAVGPEKDARLAAELRLAGADVRGYVSKARARRALPWRRGARAPVALRGVRPAGRRGDGERDAGRRRAGRGAAGGRRGRGSLRGAVRARRGGAAAALDESRAARRGGSRAGTRCTRWEETARRTLDVYRELLA